MRYAFMIVLALLAACGCDRPSGTRVDIPHEGPRGNRIISLSPAATDLLVAMGATSKIVGVSTYDSLEQVKHLPKTGDYLNVDWEKIATLKPDLLVVQVDESRLSSATRAKARELNIELVNIRLNKFTDVIIEAERLGNAVGMAQQSRTLWQSMRQKMDDVRLSTATLPRVKTLVTLDEKGLFVAGRGTFLNDLLQSAGGDNVLSSERGDYVTLDDEAVRLLAPDAVLILIPLADQKLADAHAQAFKQRFAELPAVKQGRVYVLADARALTPASNLADMAKWMADQLHPGRSAKPTGDK
jgi:iron complex transport system substrate-binding protein